MVDRQDYNERQRDELQKEYSRLSSQKTLAWLLVAASGFFFVSNLLGIDEPMNQKLGVVSLLGLIGSGVWLHTVRSELARNLRRSVENNRDLDARRKDDE
jgi:hypothetical protein